MVQVGNPLTGDVVLASVDAGFVLEGFSEGFVVVRKVDFGVSLFEVVPPDIDAVVVIWFTSAESSV